MSESINSIDHQWYKSALLVRKASDVGIVVTAISNGAVDKSSEEFGKPRVPRVRLDCELRHVVVKVGKVLGMWSNSKKTGSCVVKLMDNVDGVRPAVACNPGKIPLHRLVVVYSR